jgi:hypothetical protein
MRKMILSAIVAMATMCFTTTVSAQDDNQKGQAKECCAKKCDGQQASGCKKCTECKSTCSDTNCENCSHKGNCKHNCGKGEGYCKSKSEGCCKSKSEGCGQEKGCGKMMKCDSVKLKKGPMKLGTAEKAASKAKAREKAKVTRTAGQQAEASEKVVKQ